MHTMESRRQKQKKLRNYVPTKSRFKVEFECDTQNSDDSSDDHSMFNRKIMPDPFHQSQPTNNTAARCSTDSLLSSVGWIATSSPDKSSSNHASRSNAVKEPVKRDKYEAVLVQQYGNSGRWRLITVVPELIRQVSRRSRKTDERKNFNEVLREKKEHGEKTGRTSGCSGRFFGSAVSWFACHAIEPSRIEDA